MNSRIFSRHCARQVSVAAFGVKTMSCHVRMISVIPFARKPRDILLPKSVTPNLQTLRFKSNKKKSKKEQQEIVSDDEADEDDDLLEEGALPGEKEKILKLGQLRIDKVTRLALNSSRIIDEAFLEGRFRKNENKVHKKATSVNEGDIIDIEVGPDPKNPECIKVHRIEIMEIKEGNTHHSVRVLISKNLTVKSYAS